MTKEKVAEHRAALITAASALMQEVGFDNAGVVETSARAGLTKGALYGMFSSKSELAAEACRQSLGQGLQCWTDRQGKTPCDATAYLDQYLQPEDADYVGGSCLLASYASEVSRQGSEVKQAFTEGFLSMVQMMQEALPGPDNAASRKRALLLITALAGCVAMARATEEVDPELSLKIVAAAREVLEPLTKPVLRDQAFSTLLE